MNDAIAQAFPFVMAPHGGQLEWSKQYGTRYIATAVGVVREIVLPWVQIRHAIGMTDLKMPYGSIQDEVSFLCGPVPRELFAKFKMDAKLAYPKECAGAFVWNQVSGAWRYEARTNIEATDSHVHFHEVHLADGEQLVVDIHSHGTWPAFFSETDDKDDEGAMRLSVVLGNVMEGGGTSAARLCMAGKFFAASLGADGQVMVTL